jgi:predicted phage terminase large subunit-like protein
MVSPKQAEMLKQSLAQIIPKLDKVSAEVLIKKSKWELTRHAYQKMPDGDWWNIWLFLAGRGAGKTRTAGECLWRLAWENPKTRWLVSAPTYSDVKDVCFMGESGLLNIMPRQIIEKHTVSDNEITLTNGSIIKGIPASEPDRFRGPQFHGGWLDELAAWDYLDEAWDMIQFGMRLGDRPILICTTTPKPKPLIIDLVNRDGEDVFVTRASTYDNLVNLAPTFKQQILQYEGTSIGRQELYAEIIDPEEGGIIKRNMFRLWKADKPLPQFQFVLQSYDCATSDKTVNDPTACVVLGVFKPSPDKPMSVMLVDCWSERMQYPDLRPRVIDEATSIYGDPDEFGNGKKVDQILIEDKSAGISLIQDLQRAGLNVRAYNPGRADKTARLNIVSPIIAKGLMYLPESGINENQVRDWVEPFLNQVCAFPEVRNDDYVDALTQGLRLLRDMGFLTVDSIVDNSDMYVDETRPRRVNPYAV